MVFTFTRFNSALILEMHSSFGLKSGEYAGNGSTRAPVASIKARTFEFPETAYVEIINQTRTTSASEPLPPPMSPAALRFVNDLTNADGTHTVTLTGNIPRGSRPVLRAYRIPEPARFAQVVLAEELCKRRISAGVDLLADPDFQALSAFYTPTHLVAEIVPPPLSEQVKVMLKLSSNPHTVQFPYLVGAIAGHDRENAKRTGMEFQRRLFEKAGLDLTDWDPGDDFGRRYSADFFIKFLTYMSQQSYFPKYLNALPIMGVDGSLADVQVNSPAAGHVYAKTGTGLSFSAGNAAHIDKALAGFIKLPDGRFIVFAVFLEIEDQRGLEGVEQIEQVMGEIASVVYESLAH
jgi:serine-type D-Ala-D-Ala carboxypeptidase/endopeptidase (penicillin-binding protein 4)